MFKLAWRHLKQHKVRSLLTAMGIVLSVALMLGVGILNHSMLKNFEEMMLQTSGRTDITVIKASGFRKQELEWISNIQEIQEISAGYNVNRTIKTIDGEEEALNICGVNLTQDMKMRQYTLQQGSFFTRQTALAREALLSVESAEKLGLSLHDMVTLNTVSGKKKYQIVGILENKGAGINVFGITVYVPLEALQNDMIAGRHINTLDIDTGTERGVIQSIAEKIKKEFGTSVQVNNLATNLELAQQSMSSMVFGFNIILIVIFFVGCFLIYNTFTVVVLERIRVIGVLKTLGMDRKQTVRMVLAEGLVMGVIGTIAGLGLGILIGKGLIAVMDSTTGAVGEQTPVYIPTDSIIMAGMTGLMMPLISAWLPARNAARYSPLAAMKINDSMYSDNSKKGFIHQHKAHIGTLCLLLNVAVPYIPDEMISGEMAYIVMPFVMILLFVGIIYLVPKIVEMYSWLISPAFKYWIGMEGMIASRNLVRNKNRTSVTVSVIIIGMMVAIGFNGLFHSFRSSAEGFIEKTYHYDLNISGDLEKMNRIFAKVKQLRKMDEIDTYTVIRKETFKDVKYNFRGNIYGIIPIEYRKVGSFDLVEGQEEEIYRRLHHEENTGVIGAFIADTFHIGIGDTYTFKLSGRTMNITVVGVVNSYTMNGRVVYINKDTLDKAMRNNVIHEIMIKTALGVDLEMFKTRLKNMFPSENTVINTVARIKEEWKKNIVKGTEMFDSINFVTMTAALFGLMNTLMMAIYQRKREMGMLRSIGADRRQIRKMVFVESMAMGFISIVFGAIGGVLFTNLATAGMAEASGFKIDVYYPYGFIGLAVFLVLVCAVVAAVYPSHIAARGNIVEAIKSE